MINERMKEIREFNDVKQTELLKILNISKSTYSGWENGLDNIPLIKLNDFCNYFNVSIDYICGLSNIKHSNINKINLDAKILGNNLKEIRTFHNDTQEKISNIINVDQSNYSKYELGKILILTYPLIEFAKYYNISIDYICGKKKDKNI